VPVLDAEITARILREIVPVYLADKTRARELGADGAFRLLEPRADEPPRRCQVDLLDQRPASGGEPVSPADAPVPG
jgi:hypothetical protein